MAIQGQRVGYARVSSTDQNPDRQREQLELSGVDKLYIDHASGKDLVRPHLQELLDWVREGDTIVVTSFDRLARNVDDLRRIVQEQTRRGVRLEFIKEKLTFTGQDSPMANLLLSVLGAVAEFERELIRERQLEGIRRAKQRGVYTGRKRTLTAETIAELSKRARNGERKLALAMEYGISRETLYSYLRGNASVNTEAREPANTDAEQTEAIA